MKICKKCGFMELTKIEKEILNSLPATIPELRKKLNKSRSNINYFFRTLKGAGLIKGKKNYGTLTVWYKNKEK